MKAGTFEIVPFKKSGPFIGPQGGKWADPQHTKPFKEKKPYNSRNTTPTKKQTKAVVKMVQEGKLFPPDHPIWDELLAKDLATQEKDGSFKLTDLGREEAKQHIELFGKSLFIDLEKGGNKNWRIVTDKYTKYMPIQEIARILASRSPGKLYPWGPANIKPPDQHSPDQYPRKAKADIRTHEEYAQDLLVNAVKEARNNGAAEAAHEEARGKAKERLKEGTTPDKPSHLDAPVVPVFDMAVIGAPSKTVDAMGVLRERVANWSPPKKLSVVGGGFQDPAREAGHTLRAGSGLRSAASQDRGVVARRGGASIEVPGDAIYSALPRIGDIDPVKSPMAYLLSYGWHRKTTVEEKINDEFGGTKKHQVNAFSPKEQKALYHEFDRIIDRVIRGGDLKKLGFTSGLMREFPGGVGRTESLISYSDLKGIALDVLHAAALRYDPKQQDHPNFQAYATSTIKHRLRDYLMTAVKERAQEEEFFVAETGEERFPTKAPRTITGEELMEYHSSADHLQQAFKDTLNEEEYDALALRLGLDQSPLFDADEHEITDKDSGRAGAREIKLRSWEGVARLMAKRGHKGYDGARSDAKAASVVEGAQARIVKNMGDEDIKMLMSFTDMHLALDSGRIKMPFAGESMAKPATAGSAEMEVRHMGIRERDIPKLAAQASEKFAKLSRKSLVFIV